MLRVSSDVAIKLRSIDEANTLQDSDEGGGGGYRAAVVESKRSQKSAKKKKGKKKAVQKIPSHSDRQAFPALGSSVGTQESSDDLSLDAHLSGWVCPIPSENPMSGIHTHIDESARISSASIPIPSNKPSSMIPPPKSPFEFDLTHSSSAKTTSVSKESKRKRKKKGMNDNNHNSMREKETEVTIFDFMSGGGDGKNGRSQSAKKPRVISQRTKRKNKLKLANQQQSRSAKLRKELNEFDLKQKLSDHPMVLKEKKKNEKKERQRMKMKKKREKRKKKRREQRKKKQEREELKDNDCDCELTTTINNNNNDNDVIVIVESSMDHSKKKKSVPYSSVSELTEANDHKSEMEEQKKEKDREDDETAAEMPCELAMTGYDIGDMPDYSLASLPPPPALTELIDEDNQHCFEEERYLEEAEEEEEDANEEQPYSIEQALDDLWKEDLAYAQGKKGRKNGWKKKKKKPTTLKRRNHEMNDRLEVIITMEWMMRRVEIMVNDNKNDDHYSREDCIPLLLLSSQKKKKKKKQLVSKKTQSKLKSLGRLKHFQYDPIGMRQVWDHVTPDLSKIFDHSPSLIMSDDKRQPMLVCNQILNGHYGSTSLCRLKEKLYNETGLQRQKSMNRLNKLQPELYESRKLFQKLHCGSSSSSSSSSSIRSLKQNIDACSLVDHWQSDELNNQVGFFINRLKKMDEDKSAKEAALIVGGKKHKHNSIRRRSIISGVSECIKYLKKKPNEIFGVILASDIDLISLDSGLDSKMIDIKSMCLAMDIPVIYALKRIEMNYLINDKGGWQSCLTIIDNNNLSILDQTLWMDIIHHCNLLKEQMNLFGKDFIPLHMKMNSLISINHNPWINDAYILRCKQKAQNYVDTLNNQAREKEARIAKKRADQLKLKQSQFKLSADTPAFDPNSLTTMTLMIQDDDGRGGSSSTKRRREKKRKGKKKKREREVQKREHNRSSSMIHNERTDDSNPYPYPTAYAHASDALHYYSQKNVSSAMEYPTHISHPQLLYPHPFGSANNPYGHINNQ